MTPMMEGRSAWRTTTLPEVNSGGRSKTPSRALTRARPCGSMRHDPDAEDLEHETRGPPPWDELRLLLPAAHCMTVDASGLGEPRLGEPGCPSVGPQLGPRHRPRMSDDARHCPVPLIQGCLGLSGVQHGSGSPSSGGAEDPGVGLRWQSGTPSRSAAPASEVANRIARVMLPPSPAPSCPWQSL